MKNCLILGHRGMLGSRLLEYVPRAPGGGGFNVSGHDLPETDITDPESVAALFDEINPDVVINCAAYTNVDGAESDRDAAFDANAVGPEMLARAARASGALLVHISTDFVFDGTLLRPYREDDPPNPQGAYGKSKLAGEVAVAAIAPEHLIVRTAWLYGPNGRNFVSTILQAARDKGHLKVVNDQAGSPTFTGTLAEFVWRLAAAGARGIFHVAGSGKCTWYDLACEAVRLWGIDASVEPVTTAEFPRPAPRPANSALDCGKAERLLGIKVPPWQDGLKAYLECLN
ncbi:MAG: dTDP-4-dehydrorhamnose reductase [Planctomycetes bacterium]|nr:dTDP-4-dehydrorhamnose reductase [Planctomycetota bacterium]